MRMTKHALQGLYDSSIAYGMKKALISQHRKNTMTTRIKELEKENNELSEKCEELEALGTELEQRYKEEDEKLMSDHLLKK